MKSTYVHVIETSLDVPKCTVVGDVFVNLNLALEVICPQARCQIGYKRVHGLNTDPQRDQEVQYGP